MSTVNWAPEDEEFKLTEFIEAKIRRSSIQRSNYNPQQRPPLKPHAKAPKFSICNSQVDRPLAKNDSGPVDYSSLGTVRMDGINEATSNNTGMNERESMLAQQLINASNTEFEMYSDDMREFSLNPAMSVHDTSNFPKNEISLIDDSWGSIDMAPAHLQSLKKYCYGIYTTRSQNKLLHMKPLAVREFTSQPHKNSIDESSIHAPSSAVSFDEQIMVNEEFILMTDSSCNSD